MSGRSFVDTNVLVYAHDRSTGEKHVAARALVESLWEERSGVISTQVLQELYVNLRRKTARPLPRHEARQLLSDYLRWDLVVNTGDSILEAVEIEERYRVSFWDALIIHAAQAGAAETLYSEDLGHGHRYGAVRIVNPFHA